MRNCAFCGEDKPIRDPDARVDAFGGWVCGTCCRREDATWERDPAYTPGGAKWHADGEGYSR